MMCLVYGMFVVHEQQRLVHLSGTDGIYAVPPWLQHVPSVAASNVDGLYESGSRQSTNGAPSFGVSNTLLGSFSNKCYEMSKRTLVA